MMTVLERPASPARQPSATTFGAADLVWEQVAEAAIRAFRSGDCDAAVAHWERGLTIARRHFARDDPRLATSLVNCAFALRRREQHHTAMRYFEEADRVFERGKTWVGSMLSDQHGGTRFPPRATASFQKLLVKASMTAQQIRIEDRPPSGCLEQWSRERPAERGDIRRLLAGALLFVSSAG